MLLGFIDLQGLLPSLSGNTFTITNIKVHKTQSGYQLCSYTDFFKSLQKIFNTFQKPPFQYVNLK